MVGAAALVGAIAAWYAACAAGRHRDGREALDPFWDWGRPVSRFY
jgi:predicted transcriptional regulator